MVVASLFVSCFKEEKNFNKCFAPENLAEKCVVSVESNCSMLFITQTYRNVTKLHLSIDGEGHIFFPSMLSDEPVALVKA